MDASGDQRAGTRCIQHNVLCIVYRSCHLRSGAYLRHLDPYHRTPLADHSIDTSYWPLPCPGGELPVFVTAPLARPTGQLRVAGIAAAPEACMLLSDARHVVRVWHIS